MSGLYAGRLTPESGIGLLLDALDLFPGARIAVVGAGPLAPRLRVHPQVRLLGSRIALHEAMRSAAYVVLTGADEDAARTAMAAFSCARAVLAPRLEPLAEWIEPGRNGLLFDPEAPRDLARRLAWAEAFPERMRHMGECAQADYRARFVADWAWQSLHGDRRRQARSLS